MSRPMLPSTFELHGDVTGGGTVLQGYQTFYGPTSFDLDAKELAVPNDQNQENIKDKCISALLRALGSTSATGRELLKDRKGERVSGTCRWITKHANYVQWVDSEPTLLWISGGPGKGKTFIALYLTEIIAKREKQQGPLLYFFCRDPPQMTTGNIVLMSLIHQLLEQFPILFSHILPEFRVYGDKLFDPTNIESLPPLWQIFSKMARSQSLPKLNCVLDGLDECDPVSLKPFLAKLETLLKPADDSDSESSPSVESNEAPDQAINRIRFLITSRENHPTDLRRYLADFPSIRLDMDCKEEIEKDLMLFVSKSVEKTAKVRDWPRSSEFHDEIVGKLVQRAEGVYLWVALVMKELELKSTVEVIDTINDFPRKLEDVYAQLISQIPPSRREMASRVLLWVLGACRVLSLEELAAAVNVRPATGQTYQKAAKEVVQFCGYLLQVHQSGVQLCHATVKDYFLEMNAPNIKDMRFHFSREDIHYTISQVCLVYIEEGLANPRRALKMTTAIQDLAGHAAVLSEERVSLGHFPLAPLSIGVIPEARAKKFLSREAPLFFYALQWWPTHARVPSPRDLDKYDLDRSFLSNAMLRDSWHRIHLFLMDPRAAYDQLKARDVVKSLLHFASYYGLTELLRKVLRNQCGPQQAAPIALQLPVGLEDKESDLVNIANEDNGRTALAYAALKGSAEAVGLLVEYGASTDPVDREDRTPLHLACENGHLEVVKLLLERGASTSRLAGGLNIMELAINSGNSELVEVFCERPEGPELIGYNGSTCGPLHQAALCGQDRMLRCMLDKRPDLEVRDKSGQTLLHCAAWRASDVFYERSSTACLQLLLEKGSNVNAKDADGDTPLHIAAQFHFEDGIRLLVKYRADVHALNNSGETPIYSTIQETPSKATNLLLELGSDVNHYSTATKQSLLHYAIEKQYEDVENHKEDENAVDVLLKHGADVKSRDQHGRCPLFKASQLGNSRSMQKLLDYNADVNAQDDEGCTALYLAVRSRCHPPARFLLLKNADPKITNHQGMTALHLAVNFGDITLVQLLIAKGAQADYTMLNYAAEHNGGRIILEELIKGGADLHGCSRKGFTSLKIAACHGKTSAAAFLAAKHEELISSQHVIKTKSSPSEFDVWLWFAGVRSDALRDKLPVTLEAFCSALHTLFETLAESSKLQEKLPRDLSSAAKADKMNELFSQRGVGWLWEDFTKWFKNGKPVEVGFEEGHFDRTE